MRRQPDQRMRARPVRRRNARVGTGLLAMALLAPAPERAIAADPGEEQETESEGGTEADPNADAGEGVTELTPGQGGTGDLTDENSPMASPDSPGESGPLETSPPPEPSEDAPAARPQPPPATPPAPLPGGPRSQAPDTPSKAPGAAPTPPPRTLVAPVRRKDEVSAGRHRTATRQAPAPRPRRPIAQPGPTRSDSVQRESNAWQPTAPPTPRSPATPSGPSRRPASAGVRARPGSRVRCSASGISTLTSWEPAIRT